MNRRQEERVADLGRAFQDAVKSIINMGEEVSDRTEAVGREYESEPGPIPMPVDINDKLAQYDVTIKHVHNGFIVSVGCQTFVFESFDKLAKYMAIYYDDPSEVEDKHRKGTLFK
jgi:hypothetical protein